MQGRELASRMLEYVYSSHSTGSSCSQSMLKAISIKWLLQCSCIPEIAEAGQLGTNVRSKVASAWKTLSCCLHTCHSLACACGDIPGCVSS